MLDKNASLDSRSGATHTQTQTQPFSFPLAPFFVGVKLFFIPEAMTAGAAARHTTDLHYHTLFV